MSATIPAYICPNPVPVSEACNAYARGRTVYIVIEGEQEICPVTKMVAPFGGIVMGTVTHVGVEFQNGAGERPYIRVNAFATPSPFFMPEPIAY